MMHGDTLLRVLIVAYVVIALIYLYERNWPKCTYWLGAAIITSSVLAMK